MKKLLLNMMVTSLVLFQVPSSLSAVSPSDFIGALDLKDKEQFSLNSSSGSELRTQLRGQKHHTLYRTEEYEATCSRTLSRPATRTECTPIYEEQCFEGTREECTETSREECRETTREVCHEESREECSTEQVCRDVMREVCNSQGCHSYPTRECTNETVCHNVPHRVCESFPTRECTQVPERSCTTVPTRECRQVEVRQECHEVEYTEYYEEEYSCTKTREVAIGTELSEDIVANVLVRIEGDRSGLSGQDNFEVSVANGLDLSRPDMDLVQTKSADTHLFQLTKINEEKKVLSGKQSEINVSYLLKIIPMSDLLKERTLVSGIRPTKNELEFTFSGRALDEKSKVHLLIQKDKLIGGLKTVIDTDIAYGQLSLSNGQSAMISYSAFGVEKLNGRPHEFTVTVVSNIPEILGGVLNPQALEKNRSKFTSTKKVRVNMD